MNPSLASDGALSARSSSAADHQAAGVRWYVSAATTAASTVVSERLVGVDPPAIEGNLDHRRPIVRQRLTERLLEGGVRLDSDPAGAAGSGDCREVDGPEV